eukprot:5138519-Prymnesium_polylepis.1
MAHGSVLYEANMRARAEQGASGEGGRVGKLNRGWARPALDEEAEEEAYRPDSQTSLAAWHARMALRRHGQVVDALQ